MGVHYDIIRCVFFMMILHILLYTYGYFMYTYVRIGRRSGVGGQCILFFVYAMVREQSFVTRQALFWP